MQYHEEKILQDLENLRMGKKRGSQQTLESASFQVNVAQDSDYKRKRKDYNSYNNGFGEN